MGLEPKQRQSELGQVYAITSNEEAVGAVWVWLGGRPIQLFVTDEELSVMSERARMNQKDGVELLELAPFECAKCKDEKSKGWFWKLRNFMR